tara:strand:+ start:573 stop:2384 length:1812 start_codon:yes stop_codon:yes gene_type:complete
MDLVWSKAIKIKVHSIIWNNTLIKIDMKREIFLMIVLGFSQITTGQKKEIPHLEKLNGTVQLIVNNEPFTMLSGELHNSSTGSEHYMQPIWNRMAEKKLNTVIAPISWELIEPEEGKFDFSIVDSAVEGARKEGLKLVLIWFGSWKNGKSTYIPGWVKTDTKRFPLVKDKERGTMAILSTLGVNSLKSDAKAFSALMQHIKQIDSQEHTVVMIQVQNEIGTLDYRASYGMPNIYMRDFSDVANKKFNGPVPNELIDYLTKNKSKLHPALEKAWGDNGYLKKGNWEELFGPGKQYSGDDWKNNFSYYTEELFMAWHYAKYVGEVAKQGKDEYALPMYVNAWMKQPNGREPGQYPSGGPLPQVFDIWRAAAPSIDFFAPDIYEVEIFDWVSEEFSTSGNPLMIPETKSNPASSARAFYALGKYDAIGYAPFGIDGNGILNTTSPNDESLKTAYASLENILPIISKYRGTEKMTGLFIDSSKEKDEVVMGEYVISLKRNSFAEAQGLLGVDIENKNEKEEEAAGFLIIQLAENEFLVAGGIGSSILTISKSNNDSPTQAGYLSVDEVSYSNGEMRTHRLNGDETAFGGPVVKKGESKIFKMKMYTY